MTSEDETKTAPRMGKPLIAALVSGGLVILIGLMYIFFFAGGDSVAAGANTYPADDSAPANTTSRKYGVYKDDRALGNPNAPVVLIEYAAPTCPHCAHFFLEDFDKLKKDYIDTGKVYFVFRVFPLMPADGAVEAVARCLPTQRYFPFLSHMYRTQNRWDPEYGITAVRSALISVMGEFGVSQAQFDKCLSNTAVSERLNRISEDGQAKYDIRGVPTFVINGKATINPRGGWPKFKELLDAAAAGK